MVTFSSISHNPQLRNWNDDSILFHLELIVSGVIRSNSERHQLLEFSHAIWYSIIVDSSLVSNKFITSLLCWILNYCGSKILTISSDRRCNILLMVRLMDESQRKSYPLLNCISLQCFVNELSPPGTHSLAIISFADNISICDAHKHPDYVWFHL